MRRRIVVLYVFLAVIVSSLVAYVTYRYSSQMYIREVENSLKNEVVLLAYTLKNKNGSGINDSDVKEIVALMDANKAEKTYERRITLISREGDVIADSSALSDSMENHLDRVEVKMALEKGLGTDIRKSETTNKNLIYVAYYSEDIDCIVRISATVEHINEIRNTILFYAVIAVLFAMVISSYIALKLSNFVLSPISRLVKEYGDNKEDRESRGRDKKDEVSQLSYTLSSLTQSLEDIIKELKDRNARVNTIINSLNNAIIAVDKSMHVIMINPVAKAMFNINYKNDPVGVPLVQIIRNKRINDLLIKSITGNMVLDDEIHLTENGKRILSVHVSPIYPDEGNENNGGALALITDITQVRKLEEIRSEFVSNVTHELKTPLTSIQGFVETLKNGALYDSNVAVKFLDIIEIEADRLRSLINDILELSEIENKKQETDLSYFKLHPLVAEISEMLSNAAEDKNIDIKIQVSPEIELWANQGHIKQLLINLMDNAIKYNKRGGQVIVSAQVFGSILEISVKDTGIGIPEEHTDRIFERFYRVDKGRSREMGGTGLGLSIVKHIVQLYNGSVRLVSREGEGSEFIVTLPVIAG